MAKQRRPVTLISVAFLDVITNYSGALMILLLLFIGKKSSKPYQEFKYNAHASIDLQQGVLFDLDTTRLANLHTGQQILITIKDFKNLPIKDCPPCNPYTGPRYPEPKPCEVCPPKCPNEGCKINGDVVKYSECKNDTYTAEIMVKQAGDCGTGWKSPSGYSGLYNQPFVATFKGIDGNKAIKIVDNKNPATICWVNVLPPDCKTPSDITSNGPSSIGEINFKMTWDANARINLYVQNEKGQWLTAKAKDQARVNWGVITQNKTQIDLLRSKYLGEEQFIQKGKIISGTYKVFAHFKDVEDKKKPTAQTVTVSLYVSSKSPRSKNQSISRIVSLQKETPRNGGGTYLTTVVVSADGSIQLK